MKKTDDPDDFKFSSPQFYLMEMQKSIAYFESGNCRNIGFCVLSIFSGETVNEERQKKVNLRHIEFHRTYKDQVCSTGHFIEWLKILYHYFNKMSAMPDLALGVWDYCWAYLDEHEKNEAGVFQARLMLAQWAFNYSPDKHKKAIQTIESSNTYSDLDELCKSLFLSSGAGLGDDRVEEKKNYAEFTYKNRKSLDPPNQLLAVTNYMPFTERNKSILQDWYDSLKEYSIYAGNPNLNYRIIDPMIYQCILYHDYIFLFKIMRLVNESSDSSTIDGHAFICPVIESSKLMMTKAEIFESDSETIINAYKELTSAFNTLGHYATSLRGEFDVDFNYNNPDRFGTIDQDAPCYQLRDATDRLYNLHGPGMKSLDMVTIAPFHNHPIQSSLCHIGIEPPMQLVSMNSAIPPPSRFEHVFFLSTATITYEIEKNFISAIFGIDALIFTNPDLTTVKKYLELETITHIYISAHGIYEHWKLGEASIHFNEDHVISERELGLINNESQHEKLVILNVCDGAHSDISYNPTKCGLATTLVKKRMVVFSHHWPVNSLYAGALGCLLLYYSRHYPIRKCMLLAYKTLNKPNEEIASSLIEIDDSFLELSERVSNSSLQISEFKNLGSFCAMC